MKKGRNGILVLVLLLAVGFAAVTTTLVINGTTLFGTNSSEFDVIFTKAIIDGEDKSDTAIVEDGTKIIYTTKELAIVDETSLLEFTVTNNSTQYDAEVSIECSGGSNAGTYYEIEKNVATRIAAQTEEEGTVIVKMIKSSVNEIEEEFTCTITATAVERDTAAEKKAEKNTNVVFASDENSNGEVDFGDILSIGNERFYVLENNGSTVKMLSEFNLDISAGFNPYQGTGLQNSNVIGMKAGVDNYGTTAFAEDDNHYEYEGSLVESYNNAYSELIYNTYGVQNTATAISKDEIETIVGQTLEVNADLATLGAPSWLYSTAYWTKTANGTTHVWQVGCYDSTIGYSMMKNADFDGVRPVLIISVNDLP